MNAPGVQKILIHRLGSLGDTLVAIPAFRLVRHAFPQARITVLTNHASSDHSKSVGMASILDGSGLVEDYLQYPVGLRDASALFRLRNRIARERFDAVVYMSTPGSTAAKVIRDALFFLSCGIVRHYGIPYRERGRLNAPLAASRLYQSESDRLVSNLKKLGRVDLSEDTWWDLGLKEEEHDLARELLAGTIDDLPFFALSIGTKLQANEWTQPNWLALARALGDRHADRGLVTFGSAEEYDRSQELLDQWKGPRLNLCGKPAPRISAATFRRAELFLGHDSGPMHLAANVGTPCVAVFSARILPGVWFPRGSRNEVIYHQTECFNCTLFECITHNKKCILSIGVDEVLEAVERVRKASTTRATCHGPLSA